MRTENLKRIDAAAGLSADHADTVYRLMKVWEGNYYKNSVRSDYYHDKNQVKNLGFSVPDNFIGNVNTAVGFAGKAVDLMCARLNTDGYTLIDATDEEQRTMDGIITRNRLDGRYKKALPSVLTNCCGFWEVVRKGEHARIHFRDALTASATWDYDNECIEAAMTVEKTRPYGRRRVDVMPSVVTIHLPDTTATLTLSDDGKTWTASYANHILGRPQVEPMVFHASTTKPFGTRSRVSPALMGIIDEYQREIIRTALHSELFSSPQKVLAGIAEGQFDDVLAAKFETYMNKLIVMTKDEDGDVPSLSMLQQASMEPHIKAMEHLACRAASDSYLPVSAFGIQAGIFATAESQRASNDTLICECENVCRDHGETLSEVMRMAFATERRVSIDQLTDAENSVMVHWRNPAAPSGAARADEACKVASVVPGYAETTLCQEQLGWDEDMRARYRAERRRQEAMTVRDSILAVNNEVAV